MSLTATDTSYSAQPPAQSASECVACAHCGLPVPGAQAHEQDPLQFCCSGCRTVYQALRANGLTAYYSQREPPFVPAPAVDTDYAHFDDADFLKLYTQQRGDGRHAQLFVEGVHCAACVWLVEKLPNVLPGVFEARLQFSSGGLTLSWDPERVALSQVARVLHSFGYRVHPSRPLRDSTERTRADRELLARIGVAGAAFGNVMLLSLALYSGEAQDMSDAYLQFFRWACFIISVPSVLWTALPFFRGARAALRTRTPHMDLPISIGISAALAWGSYGTIAGRGDIYFDSVTMLVFLLLVGRWLQSKQQKAAQQATDLLFALAPSTARVFEDGSYRQVPTESVRRDAQVEIRSGERIGVDGVVLEGTAAIDESLLTGESRTRRVGPGDQVHAGTVNQDSRLLVRATRTGRETRLAQLVAQVEAASARKAPIVLLADRFSGYFLVVVLSLALLTFVLWVNTSVELAASHAIALLIITCPCALGLATPLAGAVALGRAARGGLLVKGMAALQAFTKPGLLVFDKTGTLTRGRLEIVDSDADARTLKLAAAAEAGSAHPIARCFARCVDDPAPTNEIESFVEHAGEGVSARVAGHSVLVGSARFVRRMALVETDDARTRALLSRGLSPLYIVVDGQRRATLGLGDPLRSEAAHCLKELASMGYRLAVLSGDREEVTQGVVHQLGVNFELVRGEQSPEDKLAFVEQHTQRGEPIFMVGDGVNDAGALAAADVGIAVRGGAEASLAAASVFSTEPGLYPVLRLAIGSRRTLAVIRRNMLFSLSYNVVAASLALAGWVTPLLAAVLMPLSSLTVLMSSLRSRTFNPTLCGASSSEADQPLDVQRSLHQEHQHGQQWLERGLSESPGSP